MAYLTDRNDNGVQGPAADFTCQGNLDSVHDHYFTLRERSTLVGHGVSTWSTGGYNGASALADISRRQILTCWARMIVECSGHTPHGLSFRRDVTGRA